jgi:hypothetical protein
MSENARQVSNADTFDRSEIHAFSYDILTAEKTDQKENAPCVVPIVET